jgi:hypothetical protein
MKAEGDFLWPLLHTPNSRNLFPRLQPEFEQAADGGGPIIF